ncbi:MAG: hypothetical protein LBB98_09815, partial [Treponema sp.]|nr:hypothetical protein [Treponema sp.]
MILQDIKQGDRLKGLIPNETVQIVSIQPFGEDAIELIYRKNDGSLGQQVLYANDLSTVSPDTGELLWQFDADAAQVRLVSEAYRIKLAHLFDPHLAVHTSLIQPLPHQITA